MTCPCNSTDNSSIPDLQKGGQSLVVPEFTFVTATDDLPLRLMLPIVTVLPILSLITLYQTKLMPSLSKFLACGMIFFDTVAMASLHIKEYIYDMVPFNAFHVLGVTAAFLSFLTVAMMCFERYVAISKPYVYIRYSRYGHKLAIAFWFLFPTMYYFFPAYLCRNQPEGAIKSRCYRDVILVCSVVFFTMTFSACVPSLVGILLVINHHADRTCVQKKQILLKSYKSTLAVASCLFSVVIVGTGHVIIQASTRLDDLERRNIFDYLAMFNCVIDSCAYVFWYRECRMTALRMVQWIHPGLKTKVEEMRILVFNIKTSENKPTVRGSSPNRS